MSKNNRIKSLEFHIKSDDYFGTLATVLDLTRQGFSKKNSMSKSLIDDLMYCQEHYKIVKK